MPTSTLTALVHTKNSAATLANCLASVKFANEIVVIDMQSTDETVKIAEQFTDKVFSFDDVGFVEPARNFGLSKATGSWILIIDADEEIPAELAERVTQITTGHYDLEADAYYVPRLNVIFNKKLLHTGWWPDYQLRLFKKQAVTWSDQIHSVPLIQGKVEHLPGISTKALIHHNYSQVNEYIDRLNRYTSITAIQNFSPDSQQTVHLTPSTLLRTFFAEFFARFFHHQGHRDGLHGVSLSLLQAMYQSVVAIKVWEKEGFPERKVDEETITTLRQVHQDLAYWLADYQVNNSRGITRLWWKMRRKCKI